MNGFRKAAVFVRDRCGMEKSAAKKIIKHVVSEEQAYLNLCDESYLPPDMKEALKELIQSRCLRLHS